MANLITELTHSANFVHLSPLQAEHADQDVLEGFFACWLAMMADGKLAQYYRDFVATSQSDFANAATTGTAMAATQDFLSHAPHDALATAISEQSFTDKHTIATIMPLLVHHGMARLNQLGNPHRLAYEHYASTRKSLPLWAASVLPARALNPVLDSLDGLDSLSDQSLAQDSLDDDIDALMDNAKNLSETHPAPQAVSVDALMGDDFGAFDEFDNEQSVNDSEPLFAPLNNTQESKQDGDLNQDNTLNFELPDEFLSNATGDNHSPSELKPLALEPLKLEPLELAPLELASTSSNLESTVQADFGELSLDNTSLDNTSLDSTALDSHPEPATLSTKTTTNTATDHAISEGFTLTETPAHTTASASAPTPTTPPANHVSRETGNLTADSNPFAYNLPPQTTDESDTDSDDNNISTADNPFINHPISPRKKNSVNPVMIAVPVLLLALLGGGAWYLLKQKSANQNPVAPQVATTATTMTNKPTSRLNITVGEQGTLYACQAELGNPQLQEKLMTVLNGSINATTCVLDINESFSGELIGMDRLPSVIALLKSKRFASLEMTDNQILIHAPSSDDVNWLVNEISALLNGSGITVAAMPPHNRDAVVSARLEQGRAALNALADGTGGFALARAMSLPVIDFDQAANILPASQEILNLGASHLKANPDVRLIIAAHTSSSGDTAQDLIIAQQRADAVRNYLLSKGVSDTQLVAQGVGSRFPVADNETELGRFKNNRVEFLEYSEGVMQALSPQTNTTVPMGNQDLDQGGVYYSAAQQPSEQAVYPESSVMPVQGAAQPTYGVQNGQIVQQGAPQVVIPSETAPEVNITNIVDVPSGNAPRKNSNIDDDLLKPIGSDTAVGGPSVQLEPQ